MKSISYPRQGSLRNGRVKSAETRVYTLEYKVRITRCSFLVTSEGIQPQGGKRGCAGKEAGRDPSSLHCGQALHEEYALNHLQERPIFPKFGTEGPRHQAVQSLTGTVAEPMWAPHLNSRVHAPSLSHPTSEKTSEIWVELDAAARS